MDNREDFPSVPPPLIRQNAEAVDGNPGPQDPYSSDEEDEISVFFLITLAVLVLEGTMHTYRPLTRPQPPRRR